MMIHSIPHNRPTLGWREVVAAARTLRSGWVAQGPEVAAFEGAVCSRLGLPGGHAVAFSSGTAALFVALRTHGVSGRRVAVPVYVCAAVRNAIAMASGEIVLIDIAADSPNINIEQLAASGANAAVVPHMFGIPVDLSAVPRGMTIIEDCAQSIGAKVNGRAAGLSGDSGVFSFYATKLMTTGGQGGMVVSRDRSFIDAVRDYREFDCRNDRRVRFNLQMTDVQAAIGRVQLRRLDEFVERRERLFRRYRARGVDVIGSADDGAVRYRAVIRVKKPDAVISALATKRIRAIVPVEAWELLGDADSFPEAKEFCATTVSLPIYPMLRDRDVDRIAKVCTAT